MSELKRRGRSPSPARPGAKPPPVSAKKSGDKPKVAELEADDLTMGQKLYTRFGPLLLLLPCPPLCMVLSFVTCSPAVQSPTLGGMYAYSLKHGVTGLLADSFVYAGIGDNVAWAFLFVFNFAALLVYWWPGPVKCGPITPTGHTPEYEDNGVAHFFLFTFMFLLGAYLGWYDLGIIYDCFAPTVGALNFFGLVFCLFLYVKGMYFPSTADSGPSGHGFIFDYYWGGELYPRLGGVDVKKFVNCRFSMSFWMLAGVSFAYRCAARARASPRAAARRRARRVRRVRPAACARARRGRADSPACAAPPATTRARASSYTMHGYVDPAIVLSAVSQLVYLFKFFIWEMGYMRSIDIIVDRVRGRCTAECRAARARPLTRRGASPHPCARRRRASTRHGAASCGCRRSTRCTRASSCARPRACPGPSRCSSSAWASQACSSTSGRTRSA